ncbi:MAG: GNAT family N-acetyltransferase [Firmicutes bacterium]|nr:GNAT family N-acetyltransferase [Bacillota bacterium]
MNGTTTLTTERLLLRRYEPGDAQTLHEKFGTDEKMFEFSGWNPYASLKQAEKTVAEFIEGYGTDHFYGWALELAEEKGREQAGDLVGTIGAYDFDPAENSIEIGCSIARDHWGRGFASEAVRETLRYLLEEEGIGRVTAWCAADNIGSMRAMEKAGMQQVSREAGALQIGDKVYDKLYYEIKQGEGK